MTDTGRYSVPCVSLARRRCPWLGCGIARRGVRVFVGCATDRATRCLLAQVKVNDRGV